MCFFGKERNDQPEYHSGEVWHYPVYKPSTVPRFILTGHRTPQPFSSVLNNSKVSFRGF